MFERIQSPIKNTWNHTGLGSYHVLFHTVYVNNLLIDVSTLNVLVEGTPRRGHGWRFVVKSPGVREKYGVERGIPQS